MKPRLSFCIIGLVAIGSIWIVGIFAQVKPQPANTVQTEFPLPQGIDLTGLTQTSVEIKKFRPRIPESVLFADTQIIESSLPEITREFWKIGLTEHDALWASQRAWKAARLESPLRLNPEKTIDKDSFVDHVTSDVAARIFLWQIQTENPNISKLILKRDLKLIEEAQPEIIASYQKFGWTESDARNVSFVAWKQARLESRLKPFQFMNRESFVDSAEEMGLVVFSSEPDHADVFIDGEKIGTTDKAKLLPLRYFKGGKQITVRFTKPEFPPHEMACLPIVQDTVECKAQLKRN